MEAPVTWDVLTRSRRPSADDVVPYLYEGTEEDYKLDALVEETNWCLMFEDCCKPIIPCTVQWYFWHAKPRSDATRVKRADCWVRYEVVSSPYHQDMRWQVHHIITTSSPQCRTAFLHRRLVLDRPNTSGFICISLELWARYTCIRA